MHLNPKPKPKIHSLVLDYSDLGQIMARSALPEWEPVIYSRADLPPCDGRGDPTLETYLYKMQAILKALAAQRAAGWSPLVWIDADCLFLKPCAADLLGRLQGRDALFMDNGHGEINTGAFVSQTNNEMMGIWQEIAADPKYWGGGWTAFEEQGCRDRAGRIHHQILPPLEYWSPCCPLGNSAIKGWAMPENSTPRTSRMVHLGCVFPEDKLRIMRQVMGEFGLA